MEVIIIPNFDPHPGKNDLHILIPVGFPGPDGLNQVAKNASIPGPRVAILRGRFRGYFGNQGNIQAYFPQEPNPAVSGHFWNRPGHEKDKRSPYRAYLPSGSGHP
jgi:hypothetical protein